MKVRAARLAALAAVLAASAASVGAQGPSAAPLVPLVGPVRALLVFVRFPDDDRAGGDCAGAAAVWPAPDSLPAYAHHVLAPSAAPPFADSSLTAFYHGQSNGALTLYGDAVGLVAAEPEAAYVSPSSSGNLDRDRLTREILDRLAARGLRLADYDANGDGTLDQLLVVVRSLRPEHGLARCTGAPGGVAAGCASGIADLGLNTNVDSLEPYGVRVHRQASGAYAMAQGVAPFFDTVRLLAHEFGHHLWGGHGLTGTHLAPIRSGAATGYALMVGGTDRVVGQSPFLSAAERHAVARALLTTPGATTPGATAFGATTSGAAPAPGGPAAPWIDCPSLAAAETVLLRDLATTGDCARVELGVGGSSTAYALYLSNVQPRTPFTRPRTPRTTISDACPGCVAVEWGVQASGLLIEMTARVSLGGGGLRRTVVPADGALADFQGCDLVAGVGATGTEVFGGDLAQPGTVLHLTPWTTPGLFDDVPAASRPALRPAAVDGVAAGPGGALAVTVTPDLRDAPVALVRRDWTVGPSDGRLRFRRLRVEPGATLTLDRADVTVLDGLEVAPGGRLVARGNRFGDDPARLRFGPLARLDVGGGAQLSQTLLEPADAAAGWGGVRVLPGDAGVTLSGVGLSGVRDAGGALVVDGRTVRAENLSIAETRGGPGVTVRAGARLVLVGDLQVTRSDGAALRALDGGQIGHEDIPGQASQGEVTFNGSGLEADAGEIVLGTCASPTDLASCPHAPLVLAGNTRDGGFDVRAVRGGRVVAQGHRWGVGRLDSLVVLGDGEVAVAPLAAAAPPPAAPPPAVPPAWVRVGPVAPNPSAGRAAVPLELPAAADVRVVVADVLGRVHLVWTGTLPEGQHALALGAERLAPGAYVARVWLGGRPAEARPFVVVR